VSAPTALWRRETERRRRREEEREGKGKKKKKGKRGDIFLIRPFPGMRRGDGESSRPVREVEVVVKSGNKGRRGRKKEGLRIIRGAPPSISSPSGRRARKKEGGRREQEGGGRRRKKGGKKEDSISLSANIVRSYSYVLEPREGKGGRRGGKKKKKKKNLLNSL